MGVIESCVWAFICVLMGYLIGKIRSTSVVVSAVPDYRPEGPAIHVQQDLPIAESASSKLPCAREKHVFDRVSLLVWHRDKKQQILYKNVAFQSFEHTIALKETQEALVFPMSQESPLFQRTQKTNREQKGYLVRSVGGQVFAFDVSTLPDEDGGVWFFACDVSDYERDKDLFRKSFRHFEEAMDQFPLGIVLFKKNQRLHKWNSRFARSFELDERWLARYPTLDELLDRLRYKRMLPEVIDFSDYKKQFQGFFQGVRKPHEELIHLPDSRTFRMSFSTYPDGGLLILVEEVTESLALKRQKGELETVFDALSHHMEEGILLLRVDHRLGHINPLCAELWGLDYRTSTEKSLLELLEDCRSRFYYRHYFHHYKNSLMNAVVNRTPTKDLFYLRNGSLIQFVYVSLPNGEHLLKFTDVTESQRAKGLLYESRCLFQIDQYLFRQRTEQLKGAIQEEDEAETQPLLTPLKGRSRVLDHLRDLQLSFEKDRPVVRERVMLANLLDEVLTLLDPLAQERQLTFQCLGVGQIALSLNPILAFRFLSRLMGFAMWEAVPQSLVTLSVCQKQGRILLTLSTRVNSAVKSWYQPWEFNMGLLKEMAALSGGVLRVTSSHPGRIRLTCTYQQDSLALYEGNVIPWRQKKTSPLSPKTPQQRPLIQKPLL